MKHHGIEQPPEGSVVHLNSGSPPMTVIESGDFDYQDGVAGVRCTWFDELGTCHVQEFPTSCVRLRPGLSA